MWARCEGPYTASHHLWALCQFDLVFNWPSKLTPRARGAAASAIALLYLEDHAALAEECAYVSPSWNELALPDLDAEGPLLLAARYANASVRLGHVSRAVLRVGDALQIALGSDWKARIARSFPPLARVLGAVERADARSDEMRSVKVANDPGAYVCAMRGCGVEGRGKAALRACGGPCAPAVKPHYCSKECQRLVSILFVGVDFKGMSHIHIGLEDAQSKLSRAYIA